MRTTKPRWRTAAMTKFCMNVQIVAMNRAEYENLHIYKIRDGRMADGRRIGNR